MAATSATVTSVTSSAASGVLIAANNGRYAAGDGASVIISNDSTAILYLLLGSGTASATNYSVALDAKGTTASYYEVWGYRGPIQCVWASANGSALVTELL
jgi:hypothetical protein